MRADHLNMATTDCTLLPRFRRRHSGQDCTPCHSRLSLRRVPRGHSRIVRGTSRSFRRRMRRQHPMPSPPIPPRTVPRQRARKIRGRRLPNHRRISRAYPRLQGHQPDKSIAVRTTSKSRLDYNGSHKKKLSTSSIRRVAYVTLILAAVLFDPGFDPGHVKERDGSQESSYSERRASTVEERAHGTRQSTIPAADLLLTDAADQKRNHTKCTRYPAHTPWHACTPTHIPPTIPIRTTLANTGMPPHPGPPTRTWYRLHGIEPTTGLLNVTPQPH